MRHPKFETTPEVSKRMSRVHLKGGAAESALAKALWHQGFRYRRNDKRLPGSPDIAIWKHRIAVFVDGEFWHGYDWEHRRETLRQNRAYWLEKIEENIARDRRNDQLLLYQEWIPVHFWEKDVKRDLEGCVETVVELAMERTIRRSAAAPLTEGEEEL